MTHQRILEFAGWLAEHGVTVARQCRGIPVAALRAYLKLRQRQCQAWSEALQPPSAHGLRSLLHISSWDEVRPTLEEIATSGVLLRVSCTLLHAIGQRMDIPLAIDVAGQAARAYYAVVQRAIAFVTVGVDLPCADLAALDRLGRLSDRLSDLLCGVLLPALECDRFVVDRERAKDFAETFRRRPVLMRVAVQSAAQCVPGSVHSVGIAEEVERALAACLPIVSTFSDPQKLAHRIGLHVIDGRSSGTRVSDRQRCPLAFPTHSFARSRRRLIDSIRE